MNPQTKVCATSEERTTSAALPPDVRKGSAFPSHRFPNQRGYASQGRDEASWKI